MSRSAPPDANRYLRQPELLKKSSNLALLTPGTSRDARTRGSDGRRPVDEYRDRTPKEIEAWLQRTLNADLDEFRRNIDPLKSVELRYRADEDPRNDPVVAEFCPGLTPPELRKVRAVCIPTAKTDLLLRPFAETLEVTARLSPAARAYRRKRRNAVHGILLEAQKAIRHEGAQYWAVLDIRSFFPRMDRVWLRKALQAQGYRLGFIDRVMSLVEARVVDDRGRDVVNDIGCPPGLRISGVLANIYLRDLDELILRKFKSRVRSWRYSDDIPLLGNKKHELVGAVRTIQQWLSLRGHGIKGWSCPA